VASATHISVTHDTVCPEISPVHCNAPGGLPEHTHHQGITMSRLNAGVALGLGQGWQVKGALPIDHKRLSIAYQDADGQPYQPPYGGLHHRNENLTGLGDAQWQVEYFKRVGEPWVLGAGLGSTLPLGRIEADPYARAAKSLPHQHVQMGSGTVDPTASFSAIYSGHQWGFLSTVDGRIPLYANRNEYKPSGSARASFGPTFRATSKLMFTLTTDVLGETQAFWDDTADPMSGRTAVGASVGAIYRFSTTWALMGQGRFTAFQWSQTDQITQRFIGVLGVTVTPKRSDVQ
jgi:hypothetical protein